MSNPTQKVQTARRKFEHTWSKRPVATGSSTTFYDGEMIGEQTDGYNTHFDDTQSLRFAGVYIGGIAQKFDTADPTANLKIDVDCPQTITLPLSSGTASKATDIGKIAYAVDSGHVTLDPTGLTYANPVGRVRDVIAENPLTLTGSAVEIEPFRTRAPGGYRKLAATGAQSLTRFDLNKTIEVPNTAAFTLTLPPVAQTTPGDFLAFIKTSNDTNAVTLDGNASETINGSTTNATAIVNRYDRVILVSTGAAWIIDDQGASIASLALTDNSGGATPDGTIGAVTLPDLSAWNGSTDPTATQATAIRAAITALTDAVAELAAVQNSIITALK